MRAPKAPKGLDMVANDDSADDFLEEYDALTEDVASAGHREFDNALKRWAYFLNDHELSGPIIKELTDGKDFETWLDAQQNRRGSMVGSGKFDWPVRNEERLGMQLKLFAGFVDGSIPLNNMLVHFFYRTNNFNHMIGELNSQLFSPMARDLRRHIIRESKNRPRSVPASDRIVTINHNSEAYQNTEEALSKLEVALEQVNDYPDKEDKEQKIAEISAFRRLIKASRVRVEAVIALIMKPLKWLSDHFAGGIIGYLAGELIGLLKMLIGPMLVG